MTQAIIQAVRETAKAAIMAVRDRDPIQCYKTSTNNATTGPNQPVLDLKSPGKYVGLCNFEIEVKNIFLGNYCNIQESKKIQLL